MAVSACRPLPVVADRGGRQVSSTTLSHRGCRAALFYFKFRGCGELGENPGPWFLVSVCGLYWVRWEHVLRGLWYKLVKRYVLHPLPPPMWGTSCVQAQRARRNGKNLLFYTFYEDGSRLEYLPTASPYVGEVKRVALKWPLHICNHPDPVCSIFLHVWSIT